MKKIISLILIVAFVFMPFMVNAAGEVKVTNVTVKEKSPNVVSGTPIVNGTNIKFDIKFKNVNDYVKYEVTIKNETNEDYELVNKTDTSTSSYITYSYDTNGNSIIEAGQEVKIYITAKYETAVPATALDDSGMYVDTDESVIELKSGALTVPDTMKMASVAGIVAIVALIVIGIAMIIHNNKKGAMLVMAALLLVPFTAYALKQVTLTVKAAVRINPGPSTFCVVEEYDPGQIDDVESTAYDSTLSMYSNMAFPNFKKEYSGSAPLYYLNRRVDENLGLAYNYIQFTDGVSFDAFAEENNIGGTLNDFLSKEYFEKILEVANSQEEQEALYKRSSLYITTMSACMENNKYEEGTPEYGEFQNNCVDEAYNELEGTPIKDSSYGCYTGAFTITSNVLD